MASKATRKQIFILGLTEGAVDMLWGQRFAHQEKNKTFATIRDKVKKCSAKGFKLIRQQNAALADDEFERASRIVQTLKDKIGDYCPMDIVSFLIDLINTQLTELRPGSRKHDIFNQLWFRVRELERYFDRGKAYDDSKGMEIADFFNSLEI